MAIVQLTNGKAIKRRVGNLIVEIDDEGLTLRKYRCRKRHRFPWEQIAALDESLTITGELERRDGRRRLDALGIVLSDEETEANGEGNSDGNDPIAD